MKEPKIPSRCFHCQRPDSEAPLIHLSYAGTELRICPQCMPKLIHHPETVVANLGNLPGNAGSSENAG